MRDLCSEFHRGPVCTPQANLCTAQKATLAEHTPSRPPWTGRGTLSFSFQGFHSVCHPEPGEAGGQSLLVPAAKAPAGSKLGHACALGYWERLRDLNESGGRINRISGWTGKLVWTLNLHMGKCHIWGSSPAIISLISIHQICHRKHYFLETWA